MNATDTKQQQQQSTATSTTMLENMSQKIHIDTKSNGNSSTQIPQPITSSNHHTQPQSIQNSIKTQQNDSTNNASIDSVKNCNLNLNDTNTTSENPSTKVTNITEDDDKNNNDVSTRMEIESEIEKVKKDDDSDEDPFADIEVATMDLYDITNYTFGKKNEESKCKMLQAMTLEKLSQALQKSYKERGMRRSVGAVLIIHSHNFPHVLLLQRHDGKGEFALPGGRLRPGESDEEGLLRKLRNKLYPIDEETPVNTDDDDEEQQLDVGEKIGNWYAIDFSRRYYPYIPAHVTKPKEELHVYVVSLPKSFMFAVPNNLQLIAVPLFELYNNSATYGDVICAIPALLSRYHINYC